MLTHFHSEQRTPWVQDTRGTYWEMGPCMGWAEPAMSRCSHNCNVWSRVYSCPSQGKCLQYLCWMWATSQIFVGPVIQFTHCDALLDLRLDWLDTGLQCWMDRWIRTNQEYSLNFTLQGGRMMGHINSSPSNTLITFLNTYLVRKGLGWLHHQLFLPISISFPAPTSPPSPSPSSPWPHKSPEHHSPHPSPLSFAHRRFSKAEATAPTIPMLFFRLSLPRPHYRHLLSPSLSAFWARRGCAGLCLLSTKCCRDCFTTGAPRPDGAQ